MEKLLEKYKRSILIDEAMGEKGKEYKTKEEVKERHDDIINHYVALEQQITKLLAKKISTYSFRKFDSFDEWKKEELSSYQLEDAKKINLEEAVTRELEKQFNEEKKEEE